MIKELFSNDLSTFNVFTNITEISFKGLFKEQSTEGINFVDSLFYTFDECLDKPTLLIDAAAEVQPNQLKDNMYLVTFQIPYKLGKEKLTEENCTYTPTNMPADQISYRYSTCNA